MVVLLYCLPHRIPEGGEGGRGREGVGRYIIVAALPGVASIWPEVYTDFILINHTQTCCLVTSSKYMYVSVVNINKDCNTHSVTRKHTNTHVCLLL